MKIETTPTHEIVLSLEKRGDETHLVVRDDGKPVTLGTFFHGGYYLDEKNPINLTLGGTRTGSAESSDAPSRRR
jgi:hypothetical protein